MGTNYRQPIDPSKQHIRKNLRSWIIPIIRKQNGSLVFDKPVLKSSYTTRSFTEKCFKKSLIDRRQILKKHGNRVSTRNKVTTDLSKLLENSEDFENEELESEENEL